MARANEQFTVQAETTPANAQQIPTREEFRAALAQRHGEENQQLIERACVGIAGLGGLGSAVALHLARLGVGKLVLADLDTVDLSNLHRQQYALAHLDMPKTEAIAQQIHAINPYVELELYHVKLTPENAPAIFKDCAIVCEAFDQPDQKAMLIETLLTELPETMLVSGSGMAAIDSANLIQTTHPLARLYLCGDGTTDVAEAGSLISPRVGVCAGHEASMVLRLILGMSEP